MNRMDRLFALVLQLQVRGMARAQDLAQVFEVSQRTVYRDIQALCEAGVPVVTLPGQGYALTSGYFLPPLMFTGLEAGALALGAEYIARTLDAPFRTAAESAQAKLGNALTAETRRELREVQEAVAFVYPDAAPAHHHLRELRDAILGRRVLRITYHSYGRPLAEDRDVEPYGLLHFGQAWQLLAYCRQRQAPRMFRLDRIDQVVPLNEHFEHSNNVRQHFAARGSSSATEVVEVRVASRALRWLLEERPYGLLEQQSEGQFTRLRFEVYDPERLVRWLMKWAGDVEIVSPPYLRRRIAELGELIVARHDGESGSAGRSLLDIG
jgi:predicted DNA-binding transcriptional regulator YafY